MDAPTRNLTTLRVARTVFFVFWFAFALQWLIPRVVPRLFGDEIFLREEFFHPAVYPVGGLTVAGRTLGGSTVDCSGLKRPRVGLGVNLLANPALDAPCGWGFAPHLGDKVDADSTASGGYCFRVEGESYAFQDVALGALAPSIDRGETVLAVSGRIRSAPESDPRIVVQAASRDGGDWTVLAGTLATGPERGGRWREFSRSVELPQGTRVLRVILGTAGGRGTVRFDDVSAVVRRSFTASD